MVISGEDRVSSSARIYRTWTMSVNYGHAAKDNLLTISLAETVKLRLATGHSGIYNTEIWSCRYVSNIAR